MIAPVSEHQWLTYLEQFAGWHPPRVKTYILTPHPDDESLGVGGIIYDLIKHSIDVTLIAITDGENAYPNFPNLRAIRIAEQNHALSILGLPAHKIIRLGFSDSDVLASRDLLLEKLEVLIESNSSIFATWSNDFHPDHEAVGEVALHVAKKTHSYLNYYFFWTWHKGNIATLANLPLGLYKLSAEAHLAKQEAIQAYRSQLKNSNHEPILNDLLLRPTKRYFEVILPHDY